MGRSLALSMAGGPGAAPGLLSACAALRPDSGEAARVGSESEGSRAAADRAAARGAAGAGGDLDGAFRAHSEDVRRLCRRLLGDDAAAEDAAGEAFLKARQSLAAYDPSREMRPWLFSIAANHCVDLLRRRATERRLFEERDLDPGGLADRGPSPLRQVLRAEERAAVRAAVDGLPAKYRVPLVLRHFGELDYDAIAEVLGVTRNQVGTLLFRARRRLRERLREGAR